MHDSETLIQALADADKRRAERRQFLRSASVLGMAAGSSALLAACGAGNQNKAPTPTPTSSGSPTPTPSGTPTPTYVTADALALALNLEYLEAQFFSQAAFGKPLDASLTAGATSSATAGTVTGGRQVTFADATIAQYAREIAADEKSHVGFLRTQLGSAVVAQPAINIDGGASGAFTQAARAAGVVGASGTFDPYASDVNFLLAAYFLEDVVVSAYLGLIPYVQTATLIEAAAGLQGAEAYHSGLIRSTLYAMGQTTPSIITMAGQFSDYRDSLDGTTDDDQGLTTMINGATEASIVPTDTNGIVYGRTPQQALNVLFLTAGTGVTKGGFFPSGVTGKINVT